MTITHSWNGTVLTITSDSGTSSADLKGDMGVRGPQGPGAADFSKAETITTLPQGAQYIVWVDGEVKLYTPTPPKLITFTMESYGTPYDYQAEEGMTWQEWVNSPYNVDRYMIGDIAGMGFDYVYQEMYYDWLLPDMVIQNGEYHTGSTI